jgi:hypothetical protein
MPTRDAELQLAQFCIAQRSDFDPDEWYRRFDADAGAIALVAKYLSMTSWYGHDEELERIAAKMHVAAADNSSWLFREAKAIDFDLLYFSIKLRIGINNLDVTRYRNLAIESGVSRRGQHEQAWPDR